MRGFWQTKRSRYLEGTFNEQSSFIPKHYLASTADADTVRFNFMITSFGVKTTNICRISETLERLYEIDYQTSSLWFAFTNINWLLETTLQDQ